jgi:hypothetical protein
VGFRPSLSSEANLKSFILKGFLFIQNSLDGYILAGAKLIAAVGFKPVIMMTLYVIQQPWT